MLLDRMDGVAVPAPTKGNSIGVLGLSYRSEDFYRLDGLRLPEARRPEVLDALQRELGFAELVYLATCNRIELIYSAATPIESAADPRLLHLLHRFGLPQTAARSFHLHGGSAALRYLFEVASALDSMVVGEAQILGQLKRAYQDARAEGRVGPIVSSAVEQSFRAAKEVKATTGLARRKLSLVSLVAEEVEQHLDGLEQPVVVLLGAGEMIAKVACLVAPCEEWRPGRLLFVNRTKARAEALAQTYGGEALGLDEFLANPPRVDFLATATSAGCSLVGPETVQAMRGQDGRLLIVDLAVPGDVDRQVAELEGVRLVGIEGLRERAAQNRQARQQEVVRAMPLVERAVARALEFDRERDLGELAGRLMGALDRHLAPAPEDLSQQGEHWRRLLLERAHKLLMTGIRQRTPNLECTSHAGFQGLLDESICILPNPAPMHTSLASPIGLDRRSFRALPEAQRQTLESWHGQEAIRLSSSIATFLDHLAPDCCPA